MSLKERINEDMKTAMRAKEAQRLAAIRLIMAAIKQREVDERITLDDSQVLAVLDKMLKQRNDSLTQFRAANRHDLADKEQFEIDVIKAYMPAQLSAAEVDQAIAAAISQTGAAGAKDIGKVMGILKPQLQGKADLTEVSKKVKDRLAS